SFTKIISTMVNARKISIEAIRPTAIDFTGETFNDGFNVATWVNCEIFIFLIQLSQILSQFIQKAVNAHYSTTISSISMCAGRPAPGCQSGVFPMLLACTLIYLAGLGANSILNSRRYPP